MFLDTLWFLVPFDFKCQFKAVLSQGIYTFKKKRRDAEKQSQNRT